MDQPALDQRLGTVGANPPCRSRTATQLVTHRYSRKRRRQAASTDIAQIKEGSMADRTTPSPRREATTNAPLSVFLAGLGYSHICCGRESILLDDRGVGGQPECPNHGTHDGQT